MHPCEEDLVCKASIERVPYFNAPIYLENKSQIGKVDEIFGPMNAYVSYRVDTSLYKWLLIYTCLIPFTLTQLFSIKLLPDMKASSFKSDQKVLYCVTSHVCIFSSTKIVVFSDVHRSNEVAPFGKIPSQTKE